MGAVSKYLEIDLLEEKSKTDCLRRTNRESRREKVQIYTQATFRDIYALINWLEMVARLT